MANMISSAVISAVQALQHAGREIKNFISVGTGKIFGKILELLTPKHAFTPRGEDTTTIPSMRSKKLSFEESLTFLKDEKHEKISLTKSGTRQAEKPDVAP